MVSQNNRVEWTNWTNYALFTSYMCGLNPVEFTWQKQNSMCGKIILWGNFYLSCLEKLTN